MPSETFIQNHITQLRAKVLNIYYYGKGEAHDRTGWFKKIQVYLLSVLNYFKFKKIVKAYNIQVVLAEYGMVGADAVKYCKRLRVPLVVHFHGHDAHRKKIIQQYKTRYRHLFDYASAIIVVSTKMQNALINLGAPTEKIKLNFYGVDVEKTNALNLIQKNALQAFSVGRFVDKKAPYLLILSFEKVLKEFPSAKLLIAGDGYLFETCQRIIDAKKLNNSIFLLGELAHEEVLKKMSESIVYIQHSVEAFDGDSEGTPNSILEACAIGLPVVATAHAGIQDVISNGINGYLIKEGDIDEMSKKIKELFSQPLLSMEIGANAKKNIQLNFTLQNSMERLKSILAVAVEK